MKYTAKPRNFVAKNAQTAGAGAHTDKKKAAIKDPRKAKHKKNLDTLDMVGEEFDGGGEYNDEAGMATGNLYSLARAVKGLHDTIGEDDNLPEWCQEKIAKAEMMLVGVWNYLQTQKDQGIDPQVSVSESKERCPQCGMTNCTCAPGKCKCKPIAGWIPNKGFKEAVAEGSAHGYNVAKWYGKNGDQLKLTRWLRKEAGLPKDAPVYFDDADLVYGDKTIVPGALVNTKLTFNDLLTAVAQATGGQGKQNMGGVYREAGNPQHSHQYDTTMKHADNPTVQQRMAAHDIKPGVKGYRDRIDLLKDLERTGKLKKEPKKKNTSESWYYHRLNTILESKLK